MLLTTKYRFIKSTKEFPKIWSAIPNITIIVPVKINNIWVIPKKIPEQCIVL